MMDPEKIKLADMLLERDTAIPRPARRVFLQRISKMDRRSVIAQGVANALTQPIRAGLTDVMENIRVVDILGRLGSR